MEEARQDLQGLDLALLSLLFGLLAELPVALPVTLASELEDGLRSHQGRDFFGGLHLFPQVALGLQLAQQTKEAMKGRLRLLEVAMEE